MRVENVMTSRVHTCGSNDSLNDVVRSMWDHDLGALPVVDRAGRPIAMVTDRDACMAAFTGGRRLDEIQVHTAMSRELYTCHRHDALSAAEQTMRVHQLRRLPVVDDAGGLVGMISLADIAHAHMRSPATRSSQHLIAETAVTLASICRPRVPATPAAAIVEDTGNPFEIHNSPAFREATSVRSHGRVAPARLSGALAQLRI